MNKFRIFLAAVTFNHQKVGGFFNKNRDKYEIFRQLPKNNLKKIFLKILEFVTMMTSK